MYVPSHPVVVNIRKIKYWNSLSLELCYVASDTMGLLQVTAGPLGWSCDRWLGVYASSYLMHGTRYYGTSLAIYDVTSPMGQQLPEEVRWGQMQCTVALFQTKLVPVFDLIYQFLIVIHL